MLARSLLLAKPLLPIVKAMGRERASEIRRRLISGYIADRMRRESDEWKTLKGKHGYGAELKRRTGFSSAHIANVSSGKQWAGEDFAASMAMFWFGGTRREAVVRLEDAAVEFQKSMNGGEVPSSFPERERAIAQLGDEISPETRHYLRHAVTTGTDLTLGKWVVLAMSHERLLQTERELDVATVPANPGRKSDVAPPAVAEEKARPAKRR